MEDHNSSEAVTKRAEQEDPLVMYLIVRESLSMGVGKTAAQCAHASQMLQLKFSQIVEPDRFDHIGHEDVPIAITINQKMDIFRSWLCSSFRKVVLKADDKEWEKIKTEMKDFVLVVDAGLTEIPSGSETVIGLWTMYKSDCPKLIKRLQVLK